MRDKGQGYDLDDEEEDQDHHDDHEDDDGDSHYDKHGVQHWRQDWELDPNDVVVPALDEETPAIGAFINEGDYVVIAAESHDNDFIVVHPKDVERLCTRLRALARQASNPRYRGDRHE